MNQALLFKLFTASIALMIVGWVFVFIGIVLKAQGK
jgi:uncharacterized membrane protein YGL010W